MQTCSYSNVVVCFDLSGSSLMDWHRGWPLFCPPGATVVFWTAAEFAEKLNSGYMQQYE